MFDEEVYELNGYVSNSTEDIGWHLDAIHLKQGWSYTKGNPNIKVAIVDDGIQSSHPMFEGRIVDAYNVFTQNNSLSLGVGHGTHTAGLAVGSDKFYSKFDLLMIFDADNFVDAGIFKHVNSQYLSYKPNRRPAMIQTYLDSKNNKGIVAKGYFATYRLMCTLWQSAKQFLHLSPQVGGTGFAIETSFLKEIGGFNCHSLTEDLEISAICTMKNRFIAFNRNVRIYDEKPTHLKQSLVQRTRWAQGHWYVSFKFIPILFIQLFNFKTIRNFFRKLDMIIYLLARFFCIVTCLNLLFALFWGIHLFAHAIMQSVSFKDFIFLMGNSNLIETSELIDLTSGHTWVYIVAYVCFGLSLIAVPIASLIDGTKQEKKPCIGVILT